MACQKLTHYKSAGYAHSGPQGTGMVNQQWALHIISAVRVDEAETPG